MLNGKDVIDCSSGGYTAGNFILVACGLCTECEMQYNECNGGSSKWNSEFEFYSAYRNNFNFVCVYLQEVSSEVQNENGLPVPDA